MKIQLSAMITTFNISLGLKNGTHMHLTAEGFQDLRHDALTFTDVKAAQATFDNIDASSLVQDKFKNYHVAKIWHTAHTIDAADEVQSKIVAEKTVTVDTTEGA